MSKGKVRFSIHLQIRYVLYHSPVGGRIQHKLYTLTPKDLDYFPLYYCFFVKIHCISKF